MGFVGRELERLVWSGVRPRFFAEQTNTERLLTLFFGKTLPLRRSESTALSVFSVYLSVQAAVAGSS